MVGIVCPVHNGLNFTRRCLESLCASLRCSNCIDCYQIIVVDDGSTDGTAEWIRANYQQVVLLRGDGDLWWSGAIKLGTKYALRRGCEYVLLINNDNTFREDFPHALVAFARRYGFLIVGSKVLDLTSDEIWEIGGSFNPKDGTLTRYTRSPNTGNFYVEVDWLPGMGTLIHFSVFDLVGFWDEKRFPQYFGDIDFSLRVKEHGIQQVVYLNSILWNDTSNTGWSKHEGSLPKLIRSLVSLRSHYHVIIWFRLLHTHCTTLSAVFRGMASRYARYIGGYVKHRVLRALEKRERPPAGRQH